MPSHLSSIGIPIASREAFARLARRVVNDEETMQYEVDEGLYLRWSCPSGAELWLQVNDRNQVVGMSPHFAGKNRVPVKLTRQITRPGESPFDGAFRAELTLEDDQEAALHPLVFDAPDFLRYADLRLPYEAVAQVAAFAHTLQVFAAKEALTAAPVTPPSAFVPVGAVTLEGAPIKPSPALASFTGEVRAAQERTNKLTGAAFVWLDVVLPSAVFDVVADPDLLETLPPAGACVSGTFWLSGRLVG